MHKISVWSRQEEKEDKELEDKLGRRILGLVHITDKQSGGDKEMERARRRGGGEEEKEGRKKAGEVRRGTIPRGPVNFPPFSFCVFFTAPLTPRSAQLFQGRGGG